MQCRLPRSLPRHESLEESINYSLIKGFIVSLESPNFSLGGSPASVKDTEPDTWASWEPPAPYTRLPPPRPSICPPALANLVRDPSLVTGVSCRPDPPQTAAPSPSGTGGCLQDQVQNCSGPLLCHFTSSSQHVLRCPSSAAPAPRPGLGQSAAPSLLDPAEQKDKGRDSAPRCLVCISASWKSKLLETGSWITRGMGICSRLCTSCPGVESRSCLSWRQLLGPGCVPHVAHLPCPVEGSQ